MNTITKEWLKSNDACSDGYKWFVNQDETNTAKVLLKLTAEDRFNDALWVVERILNKSQSVKLAVFSAELCLPNFESAYPDDGRPRKAIDAAKAYLKRPREKTKSAARAAASGAARAAWSASAASAAARAASAAARAAWGAARAAEARKEAQAKIIKEVIKIAGLK